MPVSNQELFDKALALTTSADENFLELAHALKALFDRDDQGFRDLVKKAGIGLRKAYYLVEIAEAFKGLGVKQSRLKALGWTKLSLLARKVNKDNVNELLAFAEANNAQKLKTFLQGDQPINNARVVTMYFTPDQYAEFEQALISNGAGRAGKGKGLVEKEKAVINLIRKT